MEVNPLNRMVASSTSQRNVANLQTAKTDSSGKYIDAVYDDASGLGVSVDDFLQLMISQLQNQDFMNPMEDTEYVTQLAQFASMQQMQELAYYSKANYVMSLVGKEVTAAKLSIGGNVEKVTGVVEKINLANNEYLVYIKDKSYNLNQIMQVHQTSEQPVIPAQPAMPAQPEMPVESEIPEESETPVEAEAAVSPDPIPEDGSGDAI